ncbi:DNRLRE domain-containing protein, partial [bacterium]
MKTAFLPSSSPQKRTALALKELIVVIAIISILAAILVPVLSRSYWGDINSETAPTAELKAASGVNERETSEPHPSSKPSNMKKSKTMSTLGAAALLATAATGHANPTYITTAQGQGADTPIRGGNWSNDNFATMDMMRVRNSASLGDSRKTYLRFDLKSLPATVKTATGATLGLRMATQEGHTPADKVWTFNVSGMRDGIAAETWNEKDVKWNNAPANDPTSPL